jgi:hypothetical protein
LSPPLNDDTSYKNKRAIITVFEEFIGCAVRTLIASLTCIFYIFALLSSNIGHVLKLIQKDSIVKNLNKTINPSNNTNPFNYNTSYIKLYTSLKDGTSNKTSNKDDFGQLLSPVKSKTYGGVSSKNLKYKNLFTNKHYKKLTKAFRQSMMSKPTGNIFKLDRRKTKGVGKGKSRRRTLKRRGNR